MRISARKLSKTMLNSAQYSNWHFEQKDIHLSTRCTVQRCQVLSAKSWHYIWGPLPFHNLAIPTKPWESNPWPPKWQPPMLPNGLICRDVPREKSLIHEQTLPYFRHNAPSAMVRPPFAPWRSFAHLAPHSTTNLSLPLSLPFSLPNSWQNTLSPNGTLATPQGHFQEIITWA